MQPNEPITPAPTQPETPPSPFSAQTLPQTPHTPERKSHKKLIIILIISGIILLAGAVAAGLYTINLLKPATTTTDNTEELWTNNPDELYYDNVSLYINSPILYKEANDGQKKLILDEGKKICENIKNGAFMADENGRIVALVYGSFATTPGSICPENASILEGVASKTADDEFYYRYGRSLLFDDTVSLNNLFIAQNICFIQATLIFGTNATTNIDQSLRAQQFACASFRGHFKTDLEYFNWSRESETEVDKQLIETAKALDLYTGICARGGLKCSQ